MKMKFLILTLCITYAVCEIGSTFNEDASTPEDIAAFRAIHEKDDYALFFHDSSDTKSKGFFESIFGIFGATEEGDEKYQALLAEKYPTLEIDTALEALKYTKDDYEVTEMPYVIAYHNGREVWRELASKDTPTIIENLIKEQESAKVTVYPKAHTPAINRSKQEVVQQLEKKEPPKPRKPTPRVTTTQNVKSQGKVDNSIVDPFNSNSHYTLNDNYVDNDYGYGQRGYRTSGAIYGAPTYSEWNNQEFVYSDPTVRTIGEQYYVAEDIIAEPVVYSTQTIRGSPIRENLGYNRASAVEVIPSNRNIVRSGLVDTGLRRQTNPTFRTVDSTIYTVGKEAQPKPQQSPEELEVKKYDADTHTLEP